MSKTEIEFGFKDVAELVGKVCYLHPIDAVKDNFSKREMGINASYEYKGDWIESFVGLQIMSNKFKQVEKVEVGDIVRVKIGIGAKSVNSDSRKGGRAVIYNNLNMLTCEILQKKEAEAEVPENQRIVNTKVQKKDDLGNPVVDELGNPVYEDDDMPF